MCNATYQVLNWGYKVYIERIQIRKIIIKMNTFKENLDISWNGMVASQKTLDLIFLSKHLNMDYLIDSIVVLESKIKTAKFWLSKSYLNVYELTNWGCGSNHRCVAICKRCRSCHFALICRWGSDGSQGGRGPSGSSPR